MSEGADHADSRGKAPAPAWRPVVGHEDHYEVSSDGAIRKRLDGKLVGQWPNYLGYMVVRLSQPRVMRLVHRIVAESFIPNPNSLPVVNHLDSNRQNNYYSNLEWCTQRHNLAHATALGRMPRDFWKNRRSPNAKMSNQQVSEIRTLRLAGGWSLGALGKQFGLSKRAVGRLVSRETYRDV